MRPTTITLAQFIIIIILHQFIVSPHHATPEPASLLVPTGLYTMIEKQLDLPWCVGECYCCKCISNLLSYKLKDGTFENICTSCKDNLRDSKGWNTKYNVEDNSEQNNR